MSKKKNLSGKCLALTSLWTFQFQNYRNSFLLFSKFFFFRFLFKIIFLKFLNFKKIYSFSCWYFQFFSRYLLLQFKCKTLNFSLLSDFLGFIYAIWVNNIKTTFSLKLFFCFEKESTFSSDFLFFYVLYLVNEQQFTPKKIFNMLNFMLQSKLDKKIVLFSKNGLILQKFIGFKIQLSGRYEATKNSMAQRVFFNVGKINSTTAKINIYFLNRFLYTKLGISNLKIWLFYIKD
uniref:Ribosomal protein S3 n=1 Tax=Periphykon beckeri TaxID=2006982 RepID=UPI0022FD9889|nr:Ribosomal protein S3 [Periphykon beckeri]WAX04133.1 Ribosomal protein S3 [Periphykon beckeri]